MTVQLKIVSGLTSLYKEVYALCILCCVGAHLMQLCITRAAVWPSSCLLDATYSLYVC